MRHSLSSLLFLFGLFLTAGEITAMELHTFDFSGNDTQLFTTLDGLNSGSHTSVGIADEVSLNFAADTGVLDLTNGLGNLGFNTLSLGSGTPQTVTLDFSSLADSQLHIHSLEVSLMMDMGTPFLQTHEFVLDPSIGSQSLYRYDNGQSMLLGSYELLESGGALVTLDNLQYGYHSLQAITIASESSHASVPEPATALLLLAGLSILGFLRIRS